MNAAATTRAPGRGAGLLITHCATLEGSHERPPVSDRLQRLLGPDLTRLLLVALTAELHKPARI
jgi:hypothetical protein